MDDPYAVLLVRMTDTDTTIRKRFHQLAEHQHPDRDGANGKPGPQWFAIAQERIKKA
jgi:DnaJ-domain-containing protein 1